LAEHSCWQAKRLIGVSAGAGIATAFATGRIPDALQAAVMRFNETRQNIIWSDVLKGRRPFVLPRIYSDWIGSFLQAADMRSLKEGPLKVDVAITRPIKYLPVTVSTLIALALYSTEKFWLKTFHGRLPHFVGLRPEYHDLTDCQKLDDARSLLLASAAAVPITPTHRVGGRPALDGGFYDNVPLPLSRAEDSNTLVLLNRYRQDLPQAFNLDDRTYFQPSRAVDATNMDCTSGINVQKTFNQGKEDFMNWLNRA
jgi:predicted acylesterase/phospholipase RssA